VRQKERRSTIFNLENNPLRYFCIDLVVQRKAGPLPQPCALVFSLDVLTTSCVHLFPANPSMESPSLLSQICCSFSDESLLKTVSWDDIANIPSIRRCDHFDLCGDETTDLLPDDTSCRKALKQERDDATIDTVLSCNSFNSIVMVEPNEESKDENSDGTPFSRHVTKPIFFRSRSTDQNPLRNSVFRRLRSKSMPE